MEKKLIPLRNIALISNLFEQIELGNKFITNNLYFNFLERIC